MGSIGLLGLVLEVDSDDCALDLGIKNAPVVFLDQEDVCIYTVHHIHMLRISATLNKLHKDVAPHTSLQVDKHPVC